ncbi:hypothetical protein GWK16_16815 [Roseomonas sp. JC162]|uniref:Uncharacterized protein n=1 Tax=Neoroseomonas marina TaxID=1232220 RepID=A0A848EEK7_9PROT|nr:hypothetical protein [Neoroseomonas marina]NMJ42911.1 hypothetical protein [Neoroseomonas marina]
MRASRSRVALVPIPGAYAVTAWLDLWSPMLAGLAPWQTAALIVPHMLGAMVRGEIPAAHRRFGGCIVGRRVA